MSFVPWADVEVAVQVIAFHSAVFTLNSCLPGRFLIETVNLHEVISLRDAYQPSADAWLSETGNAQCGGEPIILYRFAPSFWWLDQLGVLAKHNVKVVVRQTLAGSDYGLVDSIS